MEIKGECVDCGFEGNVEETTSGLMCWDCLKRLHEKTIARYCSSIYL